MERWREDVQNWWSLSSSSSSSHHSDPYGKDPFNTLNWSYACTCVVRDYWAAKRQRKRRLCMGFSLIHGFVSSRGKTSGSLHVWINSRRPNNLHVSADISRFGYWDWVREPPSDLWKRSMLLVSAIYGNLITSFYTWYIILPGKKARRCGRNRAYELVFWERGIYFLFWPQNKWRCWQGPSAGRYLPWRYLVICEFAFSYFGSSVFTHGVLW